MGFAFWFTVGMSIINLIDCLWGEEYLRATQAVYTIFLIHLISSRSQNDMPEYLPPKFNTQKSQKPQENQGKICKICLRVKPPRYYHCRICKICILQMDHHCSWLSSCIGHYNSKIYLQVLCNIQIMIIMAIISLLSPNILSQNQVKYSRSLFYTVIMLIFSAFGIYESGRMLHGFWIGVRDNQTLIQTYKGVKGRKMKFMEKIKEIFGAEMSLWWVLPTSAGMKFCEKWERVYGNGEEYDYADEYMYGKWQGQQEQQQQNQQRSQEKKEKIVTKLHAKHQ